MSVTERMLGLLGKSDAEQAQEEAIEHVVSEEAAESVAAIEPTSDLAYKAAQVLAVGLKGDLPDDLSSAEDLLGDLLKQLRSKKILIQKALRRTATSSKAQAVVRGIKKDNS